MIRQRTPIKRGKPPKRKTAHQSLVEEADSWVREIAWKRQGGCLAWLNPPERVTMRCVGSCQGAHILRKGGQYNAIRFHEDNVVGMCSHHHIMWAHQNEHDFYVWIEKLFPGRIERLKQIARESSGKIDHKELICVLKHTYNALS